MVLAGGKRRLSDGGDDGAGSGAGTTALQVSGEGEEGPSQLAKRSRVSAIVPVSAQVVAAKRVGDRTSGLAAPTMLLSGHSAAVYSLQFSPCGRHVASASFDKSILLWDVYGECRNYGVLSGHKNAVLQVQWTYDSAQLVSASADKTVGLWDAQTGQRVKKLAGHTGVVNSVCPVTKGPTLVVSASDDATAKLWDVRYKRAVKTLPDPFQVTAACFSADNAHVLTGGLDGDVKMWDLRKDAVSAVLQGHGDIVTSLALSPDGAFVLSNGMDATVRKWDVRPFVAGGDRLLKTFLGASHGFERALLRAGWSHDMRLVAAGAADRCVYVWDADSGSLRYCLPGHTGSVNEAAFHPSEPIIGSCSSDKKIFLGELADL